MKLARLLCSLPLAVLAIAGPVARSQANVVENETAVLYVDAQTGSDSNSGAISSPLKTIQAAVNKANSNNQKSIGTKIIVNAGIYRESVNIDPVSGQTAAPLTVQAATNGTAIIAASNVLTGWSSDPQYSGAFVTNWTPVQSTCALPSGWPAVQKIALHTEMLFVNSFPMTQVLNYADLKPGTFFVSTGDGTLHMWPPSGVEPSAAIIEVAERAKTISIVGRSKVVLRGLVFEHAASCINASGASITTSSNILVDSIQANWNNWGGLAISASSNVTVQNSNASYNGGVGLQGTKDQTTLLAGNETDYNNWRGAQATLYNWASGGAKFFQMRTTSVQGHASYNNQAQGLWFDTDNQNITINNATLVGSHDAALQLERNEGPITLESSHLCSSGVGLNVLTTQGLTVNNNVFYNNGATNKYQAQFYLAGSAGGISITNWQTGQVYNLITTGTAMSGNSFIDAIPGQYVFGTYLGGTDWTDFTSTLKSGSNTWYDPTTANAFRIVNGKNVDLPGWQSATGADYNSAWTAPAASPASSCAAPAPSYSDFNVSVDSGAYTMKSGVATATVGVNSFNFGAVKLSISGLPAGVKAAFSNASLSSGYTILTLTASSTSTAQTVPVTLWGISGDRVHSATFNLTVSANPAVIGTSTTLVSSASTITEGASIKLTATVTPTSGTSAPSGSVTFYNGASSLGSATLSSGAATLTTSALSAGVNSLTAVYAGTSTFNASTSSPVNVTANSGAIGTTTTLAASATSVTQNSPVTFTATVKASSTTSALPTGAVTFYNGTVSLGSAVLSSGVAKISTSSLPVGTDTITAVYSGTGTLNASTSAAVSVTVNQAVVSTTTTLTSSASTLTQNTSVTFTATVKQASGSTTPTGTVTFYNGTASLGSATLSSGQATISTSSLPVGTDAVSAAYSGGVSFNASSSSIVSVTVNPASPSAVNTVTSLSPSATSITQNSPLTFVVTVKQASGTATPTGTVSLYNGSVQIGTATLSAGAATLTTSSLPTGTDTITAKYAGTSTFNPSASGVVSVTVNPAVVNTSTTLATSATTITVNSPVTLTASVKQATGTVIPTGSLTFYNGTSQIGTATLSAGIATLTTSSLPTGTNSLSAAFTGTPTFSSSASSAIAVTVKPAVVNTSTTLTTSSATINANSPVTLTASVKQASGTTAPTGSVTFHSGAIAIGTVALASGSAVLTTSSLAAGSHTVTASYAGTSLFNASNSNAVTITVNPLTVDTTVALAASTTSLQQNSPFTLTATVKATNGATQPTGTVTFYNGTQSVGTAPLSSGTAKITTSTLPPGRQTFTAAYTGTSTFKQSTSNVLSITVTPPPTPAPTTVATNTVLSSSVPQADQGFTICLTATVAAASGSTKPSGSVDFIVGNSKIGSASLVNGKAYLTTAALPTGQVAIKASYEGNSSFAASSSSAVTVKILGPDFTVEATPSAVSATAGKSVDVDLLITPKNGFDQSPTLACSGLPDGSTCSFAKAVKNPDGTSVVQMTIQTAPITTVAKDATQSRAPFALALFPLLLWISSRQRREFRRLLSLPVLMLAVILLGAGATGCGGHASLSSVQATAATTSSITVTAKANNGINHATTVTLTLKSRS